MKIKLRQFLIINPDTNQETRNRLPFKEVIKKYKHNLLYMEECTTIRQKGFVYEGKNYKRIFVGTIDSNLKFEHYWRLRDSMN